MNHNPAPDLNPEDPEVKKCKVTALIANYEATKWKEEKLFPKVLELERFNHSSALDRLKRSTVLIQRMIEKNRPKKQYNKRPVAGPPKVEEMYSAEEVILKSVQFGISRKRSWFSESLVTVTICSRTTTAPVSGMKS